MLYAFSRDCKSNLDPLPGLCAMLLGQLTVMEEHNLHGFGVELKDVKTDFQYDTKHCDLLGLAAQTGCNQETQVASHIIHSRLH